MNVWFWASRSEACHGLLSARFDRKAITGQNYWPQGVVRPFAQPRSKPVGECPLWRTFA